jgi:hypothetical protein
MMEDLEREQVSLLVSVDSYISCLAGRETRFSSDYPQLTWFVNHPTDMGDRRRDARALGHRYNIRTLYQTC